MFSLTILYIYLVKATPVAYRNTPEILVSIKIVKSNTNTNNRNIPTDLMILIQKEWYKLERENFKSHKNT